MREQIIASLPPEPTDGDEIVHMQYTHDTSNQHKEINECSMIAIIFAAAAAEAYIYDLAARALGDDYAQKHLDGLSTDNKWVIIPRLVANYEIDKSGPAYGLLRVLVKARNELIHSKTKSMLGNQDEWPALLDKASKLLSKSDEAIKALDALAKEAANFDRFAAASFFE